MNKIFIILFVLLVTKVTGSPHQDISLNGNWNFILDPAHSGEVTPCDPIDRNLVFNRQQ